VSATSDERRRMKLRRRGRHSTPSQVEKVAEKAGRAAPAMAIAGVLVAVPHSHHGSAPVAQSKATQTTATRATAVTTAFVSKTAKAAQATSDLIYATAAPASQLPAVTSAPAVAHTTAKVTEQARRTYDVQSGDTLAGIARHFYHNANDWQWLYHENDRTVSDPNLIYPGENLYVPYDPPASYSLSNYTPRHAKVVVSTDSDDSDTSSSSSSGSSSGGSGSGSGNGGGGGGGGSISGTLSCGGLEHLWEAAGGSSGEAFIAAEIAMAESGGNQYATNPSSDTRGYWQIAPSWGSLSTYNALGNAEAAVHISADGTNWSPWTTYTSGAYSGRC
jgi:LysM repeat protein